MLLTPFRCDMFLTGPGPAGGGSTSGQVKWAHMPEKSGMAALSCTPLLAGPPAGVVVCARSGVAAAKKKKPIDVKTITVVDVMTYPLRICEFAQSHMIPWRAKRYPVSEDERLSAIAHRDGGI